MYMTQNVKDFFTQLARLANFFSLIWSIVMAVYYLITSGMTANLYTRYCDNKEEFLGLPGDCDADDRKFTLIPVLGFFIMVAWVSV